MSHLVGVEELQVGMFIHLDLGWMSHPFPLSSFRISSVEQIATIRTLGLGKLRWVPEKSELPVQVDSGVPPDGKPAASAVAAVEPCAPAETAAQAAARERRDQLAAQQAGVRLCEAQYLEATRAWCDASAKVVLQPFEARTDTVAMTKALLAKILVEGEICVRLLAGVSGHGPGAHAVNVAVISLLMGRTLGLSAEDMLDLGVGALMHDIGKIELPDRVRHDDDSFEPAELAAYRSHVEFGVAQGKRMHLSAGAQLVLAQHHEHADGSGFPLKRGIDTLSMPARIVAIVNRYDNLCNPPQAGRALTPHEALSTLFAQSRNKFDSTVLNAFIRMMGVYPAGSIVQLTDDRYAMVVGVNSTRPLKPRVLVHDAQVPRDEALVLNLEEQPDLGIRRSLRPVKLPTPAHDYLSPRPRVHYFFDVQAPADALAQGMAAP